MKQELTFSTSQIEQLMNDEFITFSKQWHGVLEMSDLQTLAKFIQQVKDKINEPVANPC